MGEGSIQYKAFQAMLTFVVFILGAVGIHWVILNRVT